MKNEIIFKQDGLTVYFDGTRYKSVLEGFVPMSLKESAKMAEEAHRLENV